MTITIDGLTKDRMLEIEAASITGGLVNGAGHLMLTRHDGVQIDAGSVIGPQGPPYVNGVDTISAQSIGGNKTFTAQVIIAKGAAGNSLSITKEPTTMAEGSIFIGRTTPSTNPQSIVFGNGVAQKMILGRPGGQDHIQFGYDSGGGFVQLGQFETTGQIKAVGASSVFGGGALGADLTGVSLGHYDGDYALIAAYQPVRPDAGLIIQSKAGGVVMLRNGTNTSRYLQLDVNGKVTITSGGGGLASDGLEVFASPNSGYAIIKGRSGWGVGAGGNMLQLDNAFGTGFAVDANSMLFWGPASNLPGIFVANATAGGGQAVPATVVGFMVINVNGIMRKIPYFAV